MPKTMIKKAMLLACTLALSACATTPPDQLPITTEKKEFLYDYSVPGISKDELYTRASDYLAITYNNSKVISRVEDKERGTIIAKAVSSWRLSIDSFVITGMPCFSNYDIYFIAKEGRARLQMVLVPGAPNPSVCGWTLPPKRDYPQIVSQFDEISKGMQNALHGNSKLDKLNDF